MGVREERRRYHKKERRKKEKKKKHHQTVSPCGRILQNEATETEPMMLMCLDMYATTTATTHTYATPSCLQASLCMCIAMCALHSERALAPYFSSPTSKQNRRSHARLKEAISHTATHMHPLSLSPHHHEATLLPYHPTHIFILPHTLHYMTLTIRYMSLLSLILSIFPHSLTHTDTHINTQIEDLISFFAILAFTSTHTDTYTPYKAHTMPSPSSSLAAHRRRLYKAGLTNGMYVCVCVCVCVCLLMCTPPPPSSLSPHQIA
jgi:hypothetical protein